MLVLGKVSYRIIQTVSSSDTKLPVIVTLLSHSLFGNLPF